MSHHIIIDWGTTNFRAFLLDGHHKTVDRFSTDQGLLSVKNKNFSGVLEECVVKWKNHIDVKRTPVYMAGMVGSKQGWKEVGYLTAPLSLNELKNHLYHFTLPWGADAFIVPGICGDNTFQLYDVMRGEETQLLGLRQLVQAENLPVILPGTHSKHVILQKNEITTFSTVMTGELFALLNNYSILTKEVPEQYEDQDGFLLGVEKGYGIPLNAVLFSARSLLLNKTLSPRAVRAYLSGLLIGSEIALLAEQDRFFIIGGEAISQRYHIAMLHLGKKAEIIDGEACFLTGMTQIYR